MLFRSPAARELAQFGIRVLAIAPGLFLTPLLAELPEEAQKSLAASIPFPKRLGRPEEVAELIVFLLSEHSSYITGQVITADGGEVMP